MIAFGILGLFVGSFLNVVVERVHSNTSWVRGRSQCPKCKHTLQWFELIPLLSFALQRGACRACGKRISWQYPLMELATGAVFAGLAAVFSLGAPLVFYIIVTAFLLMIVVYDAKWQQIPDHFTLPAFGVAFLASMAVGRDWRSVLLGITVGAGVFLLQYVVSRGTWVGSGDMRLGAVMGALLGLGGVVVALALAYISGAVFGVYLIMTRKATPKTKIAFGTFLVVATYVVLLFEERILAFFDTLYV